MSEQSTIEWSEWQEIDEEHDLPHDPEGFDLVQVELRNGVKRLMAGLNFSGGTCGCCSGVRSFYARYEDDPQPDEAMRYRKGRLV